MTKLIALLTRPEGNFKASLANHGNANASQAHMSNQWQNGRKQGQRPAPSTQIPPFLQTLIGQREGRGSDHESREGELAGPD